MNFFLESYSVIPVNKNNEMSSKILFIASEMILENLQSMRVNK